MNLNKVIFIGYNLWQIGAVIRTLGIIASVEKNQRAGTFILFSLLTPLNYNLWHRAITKGDLTHLDKQKLAHFIKTLLGIWHIYAHLLTLIPIMGTRYDVYNELLQFADKTKTPIFKATTNYLLNYQVYSIRLVFLPMLMIDFYLTLQSKDHERSNQFLSAYLSCIPNITENSGKQYMKFALSANAVSDLLLIESAILILYGKRLKRRYVDHWQTTTYKKLLQVADLRSMTPLPCQINKITSANEYYKVQNTSEYTTKYLQTFWNEQLAKEVRQTYTITSEDVSKFKDKLYQHALYKVQVPLVLEPRTSKKTTIFLPSMVSEEIKHYLDFQSAENLLLCQQSLLSSTQLERVNKQYKPYTLRFFKSLSKEKQERFEHETTNAHSHDLN